MKLQVAFFDGTIQLFPVQTPEELKEIRETISGRWSRTATLDILNFQYDGGTKLAVINMSAVKCITTEGE
jgi:hypothetical protein